MAEIHLAAVNRLFKQTEPALILIERERIKRQTIANRRLLYQRKAA